MQNLCLLIDLEGFFVEKRFIVRELGYVTRHGAAGTIFFAPPMACDELSLKDRHAAAYATRHIHGLPFEPSPEEQALPQDQLHDVVRTLHLHHGTPRNHVVAFKGGHIERDLLRALHIPHVDLQPLGCPKAQDIVNENIELWGCGHHHPTQHCGQTDAYLYWRWWRTLCN